MNRRKLFSFLAAVPVGVVAASKEASADIPVKVTPGEKCIHCGCPQHHMETDYQYYQQDVSLDHTNQNYDSYLAMTCQAKKVCSWCRLPWVGKPYKA